MQNSSANWKGPLKRTTKNAICPKLKLGWVIIRNTYILRQTVPFEVDAKTTNILPRKSQQLFTFKDQNLLADEVNDRNFNSLKKNRRPYNYKILLDPTPSLIDS